jgi:hypothetical protein
MLRFDLGHLPGKRGDLRVEFFNLSGLALASLSSIGTS